MTNSILLMIVGSLLMIFATLNDERTWEDHFSPAVGFIGVFFLVLGFLCLVGTTISHLFA